MTSLLVNQQSTGTFIYTTRHTPTVLKKRPADADALAVNAVLLVELGQFAEALVFMKKHQQLEKQLVFERVCGPLAC